jgi:hypothetical protein
MTIASEEGAGHRSDNEDVEVFKEAYKFKRMILELPNSGMVHLPYLQAVYRAKLYDLPPQKQKQLSDEIAALKGALRRREYKETAAQYVMGTIWRWSRLYGFPLPRPRDEQV